MNKKALFITVLAVIVLAISTGVRAEMQQSGSSITVTPQAVYPGEWITAAYSVYTNNNDVLISIWDVNTNTKAAGDNNYLVDKTSGEISIYAPKNPGYYILRLSRLGSPEILAESSTLEVRELSKEPEPKPEPEPEPEPMPKPEEVPVSKGITYEFDEVEVDFAAEFNALPVSVQADNWFTDIAGGVEKPLRILYGRVELKSQAGAGVVNEEFIKISGENGSERFLLNSMTTGWYDPGLYKQLMDIKSFFWSAKKLEGSTVVKDFTPPIKSVTLKKNFDENQNLTFIELYFSNDGSEDGPYIYQADMTTLNYQGDLAARN